MNKKPTRRCPTRAAARTFAVGVAVAALVGMVSAGQALAVAVPPQVSSEDQAAATRADRERRYGRAPTGTPQRFIRPEPPTGRGPQFGDEQVAPSPVRTAPAGARGGLVVIVVVAALLLAVGATTTWRVRHRRPQPESTA
jgi:hypothetical protein